MTGSRVIARAALMGAAVVLGSSVLAPSARADTFTFFLTASNLGFTGPFEKVTVTTPSLNSTTATITFDALTAPSGTPFVYAMGSSGAADVNVNAASFTVGGFSCIAFASGCSLASFDINSNNASAGFGNFNLQTNLTDGFPSSAKEITFTVTNTVSGGSFANAASVLTANARGNPAAAHSFPCTSPSDSASSTLCPGANGITGFASTPSPVVGAGLPGLVVACGGLVVLARRRRQRIV